MNNFLNQRNDSSSDRAYATPFNIDLHSVNSEDFFAEYIQRVRSLPESVKNVLMDTSTAEFIEENLGPNFNLTSEQKTEITRIIRDVLLEDLFIGDMAQSISARMRVAPDEAKRIKDSIVSVLFKTATEDIKKLQTDKFPEKVNRPAMTTEPRAPKIPERPDLKIGPDINKNNIVDLRNK